jgi:fructuronate reductase
MPLLSSNTLHKLSPTVSCFSYDRSKLKPRIVHLGMGAFARAHLALFTEDAMGADGDWGIVGVSLRHPDQRDKLAPQDFLYSATKVSNEERHSRIVGCLLGILVAPEDPTAVVSRMAAAETEIVSLTVTEKGYLHTPATGRLNLDHPDIQHDLTHPHLPRTAVGLICATLNARHAAGLPPFTILSCDNLPGNGKLLSRLVQDYAAIACPDLAGWIASHVPFPCSMVDRIVPAIVQDDIDSFEQASGLRDSAPVRHEPFRQWVLEDTFAGARPPWRNAGAQFVPDVSPYEQVKLRMLNGAHSALAYLGYLAGHETIAAAMADPPFASYVQQLWTSEIIPTLQAPPGLDLQAYANQLSSRFSNTAIHHRTWQIAMDGSQKIPQRLLASVGARLSSGASIELLCTAIAGWMRYVEGTDEAGRDIDVQDPFYDVLQSTLRGAGSDSRAKVRALLSLEQVFGSDLQLSSSFAKSLELAHEQIASIGTRKTLLNMLQKGLGREL